MTKIKVFDWVYLCLCLISCPALAQNQGAGHRPDSIVGVGSTRLNIISPSPDMTLGGAGLYVTLTAEKPFGQLPLFLDAQLNYMRGTGTVNYNFISASNVNYVATGVNVTADIFNANLGIKLKFLDSYAVRPYLETGGVGGFFQLSYDNTLRTSAVTSLGSDFKTVDGVLNFGYFMEAGFEISLASWISLDIAYKYIDMTTQPLVTVRKQTAHYAGNTYFGGLVFRF